MKTTNLILVFLTFFVLNTGCNGQAKDDEKKKSELETENVEVYYFHLTSRCVTCKAIESEAKKFVEELYGDEVAFRTYNYQDDKNAELIKKLDVKGQELFIISKKGKIDLTSEGFMYARTSPEKLREIIKKNIDPLL